MILNYDMRGLKFYVPVKYFGVYGCFFFLLQAVGLKFYVPEEYFGVWARDVDVEIMLPLSPQF